MANTGYPRNDLLGFNSVRQYTSDHVEMINLAYKTGDKSIRSLGKFYDIPKSVVGRWVKEPKVWKEKYRFNAPEKVKKGMSEKRRLSLKKFHKKVADAKKVDPDKYKGLMIRYTEDDDYEAYS